MKKLLPILALLLCSTVTAGTYDKDIQIGAGAVGIDSVVAIVEVNNTEIDSVLWKVFPVDSFITLDDSAIVTIAWFYFFTDDASATIKFTTAYEQIQAHVITSVSGADASFTYIAVDTSAAPDTAVQGVSVSAYNLSDQRVATGTTDGNGQVIFGFKVNDTIYFNSSQPIGWTWEQRDTSFAVQNGGVDTTKGNKFNPTGPVAGKAATVSVFVFNNDRTAAENVAVSAYLARSKVIDSAGFPVYNQTQTFYTDSDGLVTFTCIWSSYMIPATKWWFSTAVPGAVIKKKITIGRETTITLDLR